MTQSPGNLGADDRSSKETIVNNALALITTELVDTLPGPGDVSGDSFARDLARLFDDAYDEVLAARAWPSATTRLALTANASDQPDGAEIMGVSWYRIPESCLRIIRVCRRDSDEHVHFARMGQFVEVADRGGVIILEYVDRVDPQALIGAPLLRSAISARLAFRYARFKGAGARERDKMYAIYEDEERRAFMAEVSQTSARRARRSRVLEVMAGADHRQPLIGGD
ncbi:hypothetical protein [Parvularcula sp. LCG005]|uniref:hypothetical protein n=1 Tax=Parvularcula sp. LCG005 TaxID=3078805 RepID=UPI002943C9D5|nr:hypothetical protein [Parvularcula sp. LCG005]WOI54304.1 hypothetical protein RUI03_04710 [Parvularcula sp. LCG005]